LGLVQHLGAREHEVCRVGADGSTNRLIVMPGKKCVCQDPHICDFLVVEEGDGYGRGELSNEVALNGMEKTVDVVKELRAWNHGTILAGGCWSRETLGEPGLSEREENEETPVRHGVAESEYRENASTHRRFTTNLD